LPFNSLSAFWLAIALRAIFSFGAAFWTSRATARPLAAIETASFIARAAGATWSATAARALVARAAVTGAAVTTRARTAEPAAGTTPITVHGWRTEKLARIEVPILVLIKLLQKLAGFGQFVRGNLVVVIRIEFFEESRHWRATSIGAGIFTRSAWPATISRSASIESTLARATFARTAVRAWSSRAASSSITTRPATFVTVTWAAISAKTIRSASSEFTAFTRAASFASITTFWSTRASAAFFGGLGLFRFQEFFFGNRSV
jgi:hypothetical protein